VAFAGLGYRLLDLQVLRHEDLEAEARKNTERTYQLEPRRGDITDVKGNLLATSAFVKTVCADPSLIGTHQAEVARAIAGLLDLNEAELVQRLSPKLHATDKGVVVTNRYVVLKRKVPAETWQQIQTAMAQLSFKPEGAAFTRKEQAFYQDLRAASIFADPVDGQLRVYPSGRLASQVLGFTGGAERTNGGVRILDTIGLDGIEASMNDKLRGVRGWRSTELDAKRHEIVSLRGDDVEACDGMNVVLTIDSFLQHILEAALAEGMRTERPISISGIIIRPRTGEILAMSTLPDFDPNRPGASPEGLRNRVISDMHEPGSTFKIVVVSGALEEHLVKMTDVFDCEHGRFFYAGRVLHDHAAYGSLSVERIITRSSNIGAAKVGLVMREPLLYHYMTNFGFGFRTGIALPGEISGWAHPVKDWTKVSIAQIPMGQGVAVTSLQMAMAMCAIANQGVLMRPMLMRPMLVDHLQRTDGSIVAKYQPQTLRRVISEDTARQMVEALKTVVGPEGTAPKAALEHYTVAGKTGTAQKPPYSDNKYYASFIGFLPADDPQICVYISMDEPHSDFHQGGQVAAPVFKSVAEQAAGYLNIPPDKGELPGPPNVSVAETAAAGKTVAAHDVKTSAN
jgi:cell division protein FtsI/penicillin-binding protein 2